MTIRAAILWEVGKPRSVEEAELDVVAEEGAVRVPSDISFDVLATLGCAVLTGIGATTNAVKLQKGSRVAVIGTAGVGLNVIQGARIAECEEIIAIGRRPEPLRLAREFGATETVESEQADKVRADIVFDTVGSPATLAQAFASARKGGSVVLTGLSEGARGIISM